MKTLLTGKPYTNSVNTDLKATFARIRRKLREEEKERDSARREAEAKVKPIVRSKA